MNKTLLYRTYCEVPYKTFVFVEAISPEEARAKFYFLLSALSGRQPKDISLISLDSWYDMVNRSVSEDFDMRIFESGWLGNEIICWINSPLFLAPDNNAFLLNKWAELQLGLTENKAYTIRSQSQ